jgi:GrpB-like predicted nucleotidyltransferase (UPF0157 family)/2-polyprenyl-3-methyl-5-hydroxy-6-metoxy-1,4-benzoquinol methylase
MGEYRPGGPIILVPHDPTWASAFQHEAERIQRALGSHLVALHHLGSTAIPGIAAKPVIDMLALVDRVEALDDSPLLLTTLGYEALGEFGIPGRRYFRRETAAGVRTHQIHAFGRDSVHVQRHLDFRDYLRAHPVVAQRYEALKRDLAPRHPGQINDYTDGKTDFIRDIEGRARAWRARADESAATLIAEMQTYYGRRAPVYDASMGYDDPDVVQSLDPVAKALCDEMRDRTVLEVACGPGFWTRRVAESANSILATDFNESTLVMARAKPTDSTRVTFARADAYDLSSVDGRFTGAFAVDWLAHVPVSRVETFLDGLHSRLAPGARVVFCDQTPKATSVTGVHDVEGNHLQERLLPDGSRYRVIKHFFSDSELRERLAGRADEITIRRFGAQRRVIVAYTFPEA